MKFSEELAIEFIQNNYHPDNIEVVHLSLSEFNDGKEGVRMKGLLVIHTLPV